MGRIRPVTETHPAYDFLIYKDGDYYKIQDAKNGSIEKTGSFNEAMSRVLVNGNVILIKKGEYEITDTVQITRNDIILLGEGKATKLIYDWTPEFNVHRPMIEIKASSGNISDVHLKNLYFYGAGGYGGSNGINQAICFQNAYRCSVEGCYFENMGGHGACEFYGCYRCSVRFNHFLDGILFNAVYFYAGYGQHLVMGNQLKTQPDGGAAGVTIYACPDCSIIGNKVHDGVMVFNIEPGAHRTLIIGNAAYNIRKDGICINAEDCIVADNILYNINTIGWADRHAINIGPDTKRVKVHHNVINTAGARGINIMSGAELTTVEFNTILNTTLEPIKDEGTNSKIRFNNGFVTENSGEVTIPAGSSYVDVTHGLDITPSLKKIVLTPLDDLGGRSIWVSDANSTTFRINLSSVDSIDHTIGWSYRE